MNYGFHPDEIKTEDYIFGGFSKLSGTPLTDGHWAKYLPDFEAQNKGFETQACTSFGTLNCLETLFNFKGERQNFSDRYSAITSGTDPNSGNSPQTVIETLRKVGAIPEEQLPFGADIDSVEKFFSPKPMTAPYLSVGQKFLDKYKVGHEWVNPNPDAIKEALKYSPLGISVAAWYNKGDIYYFPEGIPHNHWCCLFDYVEGNYWLVFDSYEQDIKKIAWDANFVYIKRYSVEPNTDMNLLAQIVALLAKLAPLLSKLVSIRLKTPAISSAIPPKTPQDASPPPNPPKSLLLPFAQAITEQEGANPANNNPGNLRFTSLTKELGAIGKTPADFCIFPTRDAGVKALCDFITLASQDKLLAYHNCTIYSFFESYAPSSDDNHPKQYAETVARKIGVLPESKLKDII